jgi:hypothetical protein
MEHNEAQQTPEPGDPEVEISLVYYCASLLRVNPAELLQHVVEARA